MCVRARARNAVSRLPQHSPLLRPRPSQPDGVARNLVGEIISRFEKKGLKLVALKMASPSKEHLEKHYEDLKVRRRSPCWRRVLAHLAPATTHTRAAAAASYLRRPRPFSPV